MLIAADGEELDDPFHLAPGPWGPELVLDRGQVDHFAVCRKNRWRGGPVYQRQKVNDSTF